MLSTSMPQSSPGSLKKAEYAALLAYILSENDFPAGKALDQDEAALKQIKFAAKK